MKSSCVDCVWNVIAYAQKPDFVFRRNGRVHLNRRGSQFSRLLAVEVCASTVLMLDTQCSEVVWRVLATLSIHHFPLHFPFRASPCDITFQLDSATSEEWFVLRSSVMFLALSKLLWRQTTIALTVWFFFAEINSGRDTNVAERHTTELGILLSSHLTAEGGGGPCCIKLVCIQVVTTKWRTISDTLRSLPLGSWLKVGKSLDGPRFVLN